ncbi:MAG TPA: hypothetical protein VE645_17425 [Pseudonocardiaceae bacterium]|nr:hypothetical protein [Pseudonocardiaceae bacterium]
MLDAVPQPPPWWAKPWEITDDVEVYAERVWPLLAARPAENTIALTVI